MSTPGVVGGMTFNMQFDQLSSMLDRLADLHRREVEEVRRETAGLRSQHSDFYAGHEREGTVWSEANALVPVELEVHGDHHMKFGSHSAHITDAESQIRGRESQYDVACESMISMEFIQITALDRWASLVQQMQRPTARVAVMKRTGFLTLPVWLIANRERLQEHSMSTQGSYLNMKMKETLSIVRRQRSSSSRRAFPSFLRQPLVRLPIMHPNSKLRTLWVVACLILILYDVVIVPIDTFFNIEFDTSSSDNGFQVMSIVSGLFWSLDIVANFLTGTYIAGRLVVEPGAIALAYAKSWLFFDMCLVLAQWLTIFLSETRTPAGVQALRGLRLFRLLRLLRIGKLMFAFEFFLDAPHESVIVCSAMLKIAIVFTLMIHLLGCVWYGVGRISDDGWARDPAVVSNTILQKYLLSVHWVASQVHGSTRPMAATTLEHFFADLSLLLGFCAFVFVVANGTLVVLHFSRVEHWKMQAACARFSESHRISQVLSARIRHYLVLGYRRVGISEKVKEDVELLSALPPSVRADAIDEARWPLLEKLQVFALLQNLNARTVRTLCQDAISVSVVLEQGLAFEDGDPGKSVFIIQFGEFMYHFGARLSVEHVESGLSSWTPRRISRSSKLGVPATCALVWGNYASEAVLWTRWEHAGDLVAVRDSTTLLLSPEIFATTVRERQDLLYIVASYASAYVQWLNQANVATDLFEFVFDEDAFDETDELVSDKHLIFLSHHKAQAGTEATLMKESLTTMICDSNHPGMYFKTPVFLDSTNLQDVSLIRRSVSNSINLVLLLTPAVLKRPWCLVEIVTALNEGVQIVPVEVQRPGMTFKYPDEHFYNQLTAGKLLSNQAERLLSSEGIDLGQVHDSLRQVFTQIALPFSPHKSAQVRQAELSDILNRCSVESPFLTSASARHLKTTADVQQSTSTRQLMAMSELL